MAEDRKRIVSMRLGTADLRRVKTLALRLRVRESDIYRLAVRSLLARLAALCDEGLVGIDLMPSFIACGREMIQQFGLDARRIDAVINAGVTDPSAEVPWEDIELLALLALPEPDVLTKFRRLTGQNPGPGGIPGYVEAHLRRRYLAGPSAQHGEPQRPVRDGRRGSGRVPPRPVREGELETSGAEAP